VKRLVVKSGEKQLTEISIVAKDVDFTLLNLTGKEQLYFCDKS
jgi:hypothetical protein